MTNVNKDMNKLDNSMILDKDTKQETIVVSSEDYRKLLVKNERLEKRLARVRRKRDGMRKYKDSIIKTLQNSAFEQRVHESMLYNRNNELDERIKQLISRDFGWVILVTVIAVSTIIGFVLTK